MPTEIELPTSSYAASMRLAIAEAELARGTTGDNPWVGCAIEDARGTLISLGHTLGPGEDHSEIAALRQAKANGVDVTGATLFSTLEPCAFHGRTPACARAIVDHGIARVIIAMRDPHPRVDGEGIRILERAGIDVVEGVCEDEVRRQLGAWVFSYHPHEPARRAAKLRLTRPREEVARLIAEMYAVELSLAQAVM